MTRRRDGQEPVAIGSEAGTHDDRAISIVAIYGKPDPEYEEDDRGHRSKPSGLGGPGCRGRSGRLRSFPAAGRGVEVAVREDISDANSGTAFFGGKVAGFAGDRLPMAMAVFVRS